MDDFEDLKDIKTLNLKSNEYNSVEQAKQMNFLKVQLKYEKDINEERAKEIDFLKNELDKFK